MKKSIFILCLGFLFLFSCSPISKKSPLSEQNIAFSDIQNNPKLYKNKEVFWGGRIFSCKNKETFTQIEVIEFPIDKEGKIITQLNSRGRFLIKTPEFLDCQVYTPGNSILVKGIIKGIEPGKIEERTYNFIVIEPKKVKLLGAEAEKVYPIEEECDEWHPWKYPCWEKSW